MQKIYCTCGAVNIYEIKKPNLCAYCGNSFNSAFKKPIEAIQETKTVKANKVEDIDDFSDENDEIEDREAIKKLKRIAKASAKKVQISMAKNMTMKDLANVENQIVREPKSAQNNKDQE